MGETTPGNEFEGKPKETAVNIDSGTAYSCMYAQENIEAKIIEKNQWNRTTPGYVAFTDNEQSTENVAVTRKSPEYIARMGIMR